MNTIDQRATQRNQGAITWILGATSLLLLVAGACLYAQHRHDREVNAILRKELAELQADVQMQITQAIQAASTNLQKQLQTDLSVLADSSRKAIQEEARVQLSDFVARAEERFQTNTLDTIRTKKVIVVDNAGIQRVFIGTHISEYSGFPSTVIKLESPTSHNPLLISSSDSSSAILLSKRAALLAEDNKSATLAFFATEYASNAHPMMILKAIKERNLAELYLCANSGVPQVQLTTQPDYNSLVIFDKSGPEAVPSKVRGALGVTAEGMAFSDLVNKHGEVTCSVRTQNDPYAVSFLKTDPSTTAWNAASAFSTIMTFIDLFRK